MAAVFKSLYSKATSTSKELYAPMTSSDKSIDYTDTTSSEDLNSSHGLLEDDAKSDFDLTPRHQRRRDFAAIIHILIFATYTFAFIAVTTKWKQSAAARAGGPYIYTPAQEAVEYQREYYDGSLGLKNKWIGDPRPELEEAWHQLTINNNLKFSEEEIGKLNKTALQLADGSGMYYGQLNVYHHLHCLQKYLREGSVYYYESYEVTTKDHIDHCVDDIRQALMCQADTSAAVFRWEDGLRRPQPDFRTYHECVNWDKFDAWATSRRFSMFDQKSLVNPHYGIAFPLINGSIEYTPPGPGMHVVWPEDL